MEPASQRPDLRVLTSDHEVSYLTVLRNRNYLRFFLAQAVSSLGDWVGVFAIAVYAERLGQATGVGTVLIARVLPGFVVGPLAGVIADRWDRKRTMIVADLLRAVMIFSLPFFPNLLYLIVISALLESLTLVWGPAKDASLPHLVPAPHLTHANSLNLLAVYAPWPLASIVFASLVTLAAFIGRTVPVLEGLGEAHEALALWVDSFTFLASAAIISTLTIATSTRRAERLDLREAKRDLLEGLKFVVEHKQVRPWILGIGFTFAAAGGVFSLGITFVRTALGGGDRGFGFLVGFLATGMIVGLLAVGSLARRIQKDVLFSSSVLLLGVGLIMLATMDSLETAIPVASALGFFGGAAYSTGYSLVHETTTDEVRGRTFSAAYTVIRIAMLIGLGIFPLIAGAIGDERQLLGVELQGTRVTLWLAGFVVIGGAVLSMRAINARRVLSGQQPSGDKGYFIVFEGGDGAGKTTQMDALVSWLEARGDEVVMTREPGGTGIGERIRAILLDPESGEIEPHAEALLYAADRAQHVNDVVRPALERGQTVVSDRFVDSSLAYQGVARGLGVEEIYRLSEWATGGLMPDVVFFLELDARSALHRVTDEHDRLEREAADFHEKVAEAYAQLATRFPERFVVLDASRPQAEVHADVVETLEKRLSERGLALRAMHQLGPPGPPIPR